MALVTAIFGKRIEGVVGLEQAFHPLLCFHFELEVVIGILLLLVQLLALVELA